VGVREGASYPDAGFLSLGSALVLAQRAGVHQVVTVPAGSMVHDQHLLGGRLEPVRRVAVGGL
jgi:hypothetical protein